MESDTTDQMGASDGGADRLVSGQDDESLHSEGMELIYNDPESEAVLEQLIETITGELAAQAHVFQRVLTRSEDLDFIAASVADEVLTYFVVRPRSEDEARYSWRKG